MDRKVALAFQPQAVILPLDQLLPLRKLTSSARNSEKYKCIASSLREIGLIEPLIVYPQEGTGHQYILLDGTMRRDILKSQGATEALCLIATEDEAYTYNHKVNQITAIQEHFMVLKALENGVPEERIAATLNVDVAHIRRKQNLLAGICPEAVTMLKTRHVSAATLRELKRVLPMRQIEMAELMISSMNFTTGYAKCLYAATPESQRIESEKPKDDHGMSAEDQARIEREMRDQVRTYKMIEETHGENVLHLVLATGYLRSLLNNARVVRYFSKHHADILAEFQRLIEAPDLDVASDPAGE